MIPTQIYLGPYIDTRIHTHTHIDSYSHLTTVQMHTPARSYIHTYMHESREETDEENRHRPWLLIRKTKKNTKKNEAGSREAQEQPKAYDLLGSGRCSIVRKLDVPIKAVSQY